MTAESTVKDLVLRRFEEAGFRPDFLEVKSFPGEVIAIVEVSHDYERAIEIATRIDAEIDNGFVTVRRSSATIPTSINKNRLKDIQDERIPELIELMNSRARTSESQPSLKYIRDAEERLNLALSPRHYLIFGRRGVGKTTFQRI